MAGADGHDRKERRVPCHKRRSALGAALLEGVRRGERLRNQERAQAKDPEERVRRLRIDETFVLRWSDRYLRDLSEADAAFEEHLFTDLAGDLRDRGYLTRGELMTIGCWKSPRVRSRLEQNDPRRVRAITSLAFAPDTTERASLLTALSGVGEPIASAILAVWDPHHYTVFDWRATETLQAAGLFRSSGDRVTLGIYLAVCRQVVDRLDLPEGPVSKLRLLDRALWTYSAQRVG